MRSPKPARHRARGWRQLSWHAVLLRALLSNRLVDETEIVLSYGQTTAIAELPDELDCALETIDCGRVLPALQRQQRPIVNGVCESSCVSRQLPLLNGTVECGRGADVVVHSEMECAESVEHICSLARLHRAGHVNDPLEPGDAFAVVAAVVPEPPQRPGELSRRQQRPAAQRTIPAMPRCWRVRGCTTRARLGLRYPRDRSDSGARARTCAASAARVASRSPRITDSFRPKSRIV